MRTAHPIHLRSWINIKQLPVSKLYNLDTSNKIIEVSKKLTPKENVCIISYLQK